MPDRCTACKILGRACTTTLLTNISPAGQDICYGRPSLNKRLYAIDSPNFEVFGAEESDEEGKDEEGGNDA